MVLRDRVGSSLEQTPCPPCRLRADRHGRMRQKVQGRHFCPAWRGAMGFPGACGRSRDERLRFDADVVLRIGCDRGVVTHLEHTCIVAYHGVAAASAEPFCQITGNFDRWFRSGRLVDDNGQILESISSHGRRFPMGSPQRWRHRPVPIRQALRPAGPQQLPWS